MEKPLENKAGIMAILPFDHRTGLYRELGWTEPLTPDQVTQMKDSRQLIYESIKQAVAGGIPIQNVAVLTDDIFGSEVLADAKREGFTTFLTTEKSGIPCFDFEHGEAFADAIEKIKPDFVKALVRYNPEGNNEDNQKSLTNLKKLSDFAHANNYKFLIEPLIAATESQLELLGNDNHRYDDEVRPTLTVRMIHEMHAAGIEPDIWKIEGFEKLQPFAVVVAAAKSAGRDHVGIICLGRNETDEVVASWLRAGSQVPGVIGFAVGRTVFLEALKQYFAATMTRTQAVVAIATKFRYFYDIFNQ